MSDPLTFDEYQRNAQVTYPKKKRPQGESGMCMASLGLAGEVGEVVDHIKKHIFHGHSLDPEKVKDELGDVLWYIAAMCNNFDFTLADVAAFNNAKLKARYPEGFSKKASRNRVE